MWTQRLRRVLFSLPFIAIPAFAQYIVESSSFGQGDKMSPNRFGIPHWHISGDGQSIPQLLTDKVVLTPPYPGNRRGAIWAETSLAQSEWTVDFEFRATGPERGGGNLQLWYLKDGRPHVETPSIYTVGRFDGLALVFDMYGGKGGSVRGFMNDGSTEYKDHDIIHGLAFGHCDYSYRNLGRPSKVQIKQLTESFEVVVDGRRCFWTDKIKLPAGYYFGVSAASADNPDSFEVFKFVTSTAPGVTRELPRKDPPAQRPPQGGQTNDQGSQQPSSNAQFAVQFTDLQNRLSALSQSLDNVFKEVQSLSAKSDARHNDLSHRVSSNQKLESMDQKIQNIENTLHSYAGQFSNIQGMVQHSHSTLNEGLTEHLTHIVTTKSPKMGTFVVVIIVFQLLLAGLYVVYKRRRANGPKKYL